MPAHFIQVGEPAHEAEKQGLVQDPVTPFFTTPHFDGHPSVLLRLSLVGRLTVAELTEAVEDAWLAQASARPPTDRLRAHEQTEDA